jgi:hypothetical protein
MTPSLGWLIALGASAPWVIAADLLSDSLAGWGLAIFVPGALLTSPALRLGTVQALALAACLGFAHEARRPIPDGAAAFTLMAAMLVAVNWRGPLRRRRRAWVAGWMNAACALVILACAGLGRADWLAWTWSLPLHALLAFAVGAAIQPLAGATQELLLARAGFPVLREP